MTILKLLYNPISPPCRFILMLVETLNLKVQLEEVDILTKKYIQQISKINPQHTVPILQDGQKTLWESHAIAPYLIAKYSEDESLYPNDINRRAVIDQRLHFDTGVLYPTLKRIVKPILFKNQFGIYKNDIQDINASYRFMDNFTQGGKWLCGNQMTIADLSCIATLSTLDLLYPVTPKTYPNLHKFIRKCEDAPFYCKCNIPGLDRLAKEIHGRLIFCNKYKYKV